MLFDLDYKEVSLEDGVTIEIKPVDSIRYTLLVRYMKEVMVSKGGSDDVAFGMQQLSNPELIETCKQVFPDHCRNLKGIQIKQEGSVRDAVIEDLYGTSAGLSICLRVISELFSASTVSRSEEDTVKKE